MSHLAERAVFIATSEEISKIPRISKERSDRCYKFFLSCMEENERIEKERIVSTNENIEA